MSISYFIELIHSIGDGNAPTWVYIILLFIPIAILVTLREGYCWFSKANTVTKRLSKLEFQLKEINRTLKAIHILLDGPRQALRPTEEKVAPASRFNMDEEDWTKE